MEFWPPEIPITKKPSKKQLECLQAVIRSNGGGCHIRDWPRSVVVGLLNRHFIQGKSNYEGRFVHTRKGLEYWRSITPTQGDR